MHLIYLTPAAADAIRQYRTTLQVADEYFLRVGIKQKNAQSKGLLIGFDLKTDKDRETEIDGIKIIYHPGQALFFAGMMIDFATRDDKKGFVLIEKKPAM